MGVGESSKVTHVSVSPTKAHVRERNMRQVAGNKQKAAHTEFKTPDKTDSVEVQTPMKVNFERATLQNKLVRKNAKATSVSKTCSLNLFTPCRVLVTRPSVFPARPLSISR
jgi:hypothetical protein